MEGPDETDDHYSLDEQPRPFIPNTSDNDKEHKNKSHRVLIHCHAGISRSVTIAAAYLMQKKRQNVEDTIQLIKSARPIADPNDGFMEQLKLWWNVRFRLYRIPEFRVPCEEYEELRRLLRLKG